MESGRPFIEKLHELPPAGIRDLLADSEAAGSRIARRLVYEWADRTYRFDRPGAALFGAWVVGRLIYVLTLSRRLGVGRQLMTQVIDSAGGRFDSLRPRTNHEAAARLYVAMGFRAFTGAGECTHILAFARRSG